MYYLHKILIKHHPKDYRWSTYCFKCGELLRTEETTYDGHRNEGTGQYINYLTFKHCRYGKKAIRVCEKCIKK